MISRKLFVLTLALAGLALAVPSSLWAQIMGGQDVLIEDLGITSDAVTHDVAVAGDGTLFAACHGDPALTVLNVYRSTDGGSTWSLWDQLESQYTEGRVHEARLTTTHATPSKLVVAWVDERLDSPYSAVRVSTSDASATAPLWNHAEVFEALGPPMTEPRVDAVPWIGADRIGLAWRQGLLLKFAGSYNDGTSWSGPVTVTSAAGGLFVRDLDLAVDNYDVAHLVWVTYDLGSGSARVRYNRGAGGGLDPSDWSADQIIYGTSSEDLITVTVVADHSVDEGAVIAAGGEYGSRVPMRILTSDDAGLDWSAASLVDDHYHPNAAWGVAGPFIGANTANSSGFVQACAVLSYDGFNWNSAELMQYPGEGSPLPGAALAVDNSRGGQPLAVEMRTLLGAIDEYGLWFDAAWRDAPGFGVPDPHDIHRTAGRAINRPVLTGDLNGDGTPEVVFTEESVTGSDRVFFFGAADGELELLYLNYEVHPESEVALVDINGDGDVEAFWINDDRELEGRRGNGGRVAGFPVDLDLGLGPFWISGAQVTGDTGQDVVVAGSSKVHVVGQDGIERPGWPWIAPHEAGLNYGRVALGDVDADGHCDLVIPMTGRVVVLNRYAQTLSLFGDGQAAPSSPSLADLDDDGDLEIAIPRLDGTVHLVHHDGTSVSSSWPYDTGNNGMPSQIALADIGGDERRDLVFMDHAHTVHAVTPAGIVLRQKDIDVDLGSAVVDPIVALVGTDEVTVNVGAADGIMRVFGVGGRQEGWPRNMAAPILAASAVADVDADGILEMIVPTTESLWVLDMGVAPVDSLDLWTMSGFDPGRSGCVPAAAPAVAAVATTVPRVAALHGAAPNPFNPRTTIRFSLAGDVPQASLRVYDVAGRLVKTLLQGPMSAGEHTTIWDGIDTDGLAVASGVYYCRLEVGGTAETRSMVLVR
jgi:hypothetical protein